MGTKRPKLTLYGAPASGSVAVEAALTVLGVPYTLVDGATWAEETARARIAPVNPRCDRFRHWCFKTAKS